MSAVELIGGTYLVLVVGVVLALAVLGRFNDRPSTPAAPADLGWLADQPAEVVRLSPEEIARRIALFEAEFTTPSTQEGPA